jgi:Fic family protein
MGNKIKEEQIHFLQTIKPIFETKTTPIIPIDKQENVKVAPKASDTRFDELVERIERMEKMLEMPEDEGVRKGRVKEQVISLLQQNKKLTSTQLSKLIGLSRTRCNEYFRELLKEGKAEGVIINRQKYYKLVGK